MWLGLGYRLYSFSWNKEHRSDSWFPVSLRHVTVVVIVRVFMIDRSRLGPWLGLGSVLKLTSDWVTPCWQLLSPLAHTPAFCLLLSPGPWHWGQWGIRHRRSRRWGDPATRGPGDWVRPATSDTSGWWALVSQKSGHWAQTRSRCDSGLDNVNTHDKTGDACLVTIWELYMNHCGGTLFPFFARLLGQAGLA